jgi:Cu(I)/Ag(I) efflux system membrane fusion protein
MDMQLVPVYADAANDEGSVSISPRVQQSLGVRVVEVGISTLARTIVAPGTVAWNDRDVAVVSTRVAGTVEKLYARAPLDAVRAGQAFAELYVPDWIAAQEEYLAVKRLTVHDQRDLHELVDAARTRMLIAGMPDDLLRALESSGQVQRRMTLYAPVSGVIAELAVREGANVLPGAMLGRINSVATVWIYAEVPETVSAVVRPGMKVNARVAGLPDSTFPGTVAAILPEVNVATRTVRVRIETRNPGGRLKPGMFATIDFSPSEKREFLAVPSEAIIRTGTRTVVIAAEDGGKFRAVDVEAGDEANGQTEIRSGLQRGQHIVASGQFMIDSEASLKSALTRMIEPSPAVPMTPDTNVTPAPPAATAAPAGSAIHQSEGVVEAVAAGALTLSHGPIPTLRWPAMTMDFQPPASGVPAAIKPGTRVRFSFRQAVDGEYQIVAIEAVPAPAPATTAAAAAAVPGAKR